MTDRVWLALAVVAGVAFRLAFFAGGPLYESTRSNSYWRMSESLLRHHTLGFEGVPSTYQEPLYPVFLAAARLVAFDEIRVVLLLQILVSAVAVVLVYRLALLLSGEPRVALIAAFTFALYPYLARHSLSLIPLSVFTTALIAAVYATCAHESRKGALLCGIAWGVATGFRATALPILLLCLPWVAWRRSPLHAAAVAVGAALVLAPFAVRNHAVDGALVPTAAASTSSRETASTRTS